MIYNESNKLFIRRIILNKKFKFFLFFFYIKSKYCNSIIEYVVPIYCTVYVECSAIAQS